LVLGLAALAPALGAPAAQANEAKVVIYAGTCLLRVTFHLSEPIGYATLGAPGYDVEVQPVTPCVLSDDVLDPLRNTTVSASGGSSLFNCDSVVGFGGWSQWWEKSGGVNSPQPVVGGRHKLFGTFDNWLLELEGPSVVTFAGAAHLRLDPLYAGFTAAACSNGSLWELHTIGLQVFEDPQP
jgi:hypothetical protein